MRRHGDLPFKEMRGLLREDVPMTCPQCQRYVLIEGACIGCGYGFKATRRKRRQPKRPERKARPELKEPWWTK